MGCMECSRNGCPHVMCDQLILNDTRYICSSCYLELQEAKRLWPSRMSAKELRDRIKAFLRTESGTHTMLEGSEIDAEFDRLMGGSSEE